MSQPSCAPFATYSCIFVCKLAKSRERHGFHQGHGGQDGGRRAPSHRRVGPWRGQLERGLHATSAGWFSCTLATKRTHDQRRGLTLEGEPRCALGAWPLHQLSGGRMPGGGAQILAALGRPVGGAERPYRSHRHHLMSPRRPLVQPHAHRHMPSAAHRPARRCPVSLMGPDGLPGLTAVRDADGWMSRLSRASSVAISAYIHVPPWHHTCSNLPKL